MVERDGVSDTHVTGNSSATTNTELTLLFSTKFLNQDGTERLLKFFSDNIRNPNTRKAYVRAIRDFFRWTEARGISLTAICPGQIATYMEELSGAVPSLKQRLAAIRMLFDWLVTGGVLPTNPTVDARSSRPVVKVGKTSVLTAQEVWPLLKSMPFDKSAVTRDRPLIDIIYDQRRLNLWKKFWSE